MKAVLGRLRASVWRIRSWQRGGAQSRRAVSTQAAVGRTRGASSCRAAGIIEPPRLWFWTLPKASYVIWTNHFSQSLRFFICKMGAIILMLPASQRCRQGMVISAHWAQAVVAAAPPKAPHCSPPPPAPAHHIQLALLIQDAGQRHRSEHTGCQGAVGVDGSSVLGVSVIGHS